MDSEFYLKFENKFRGSKESISFRMSYYNDLMHSIANNYKHPKLLDIGCGRGEWISNCTKLGFDTTGIETNHKMLEQCLSSGLRVHKGDALKISSNIPSNEFEVVSAFHLVEHLTHDYLESLLLELKRIISKNGFLILETPNIENLLVATSTFHLDPTHVTQINSSYLVHLLKAIGFYQVELFYINGGPLQDTLKDRTTRIFNGVAQDIVIVASTSLESFESISKDCTNWREKLNLGITTLQAASEFDQVRDSKELYLFHKIKEQEEAIFVLRRKLLVMEKQHEIITSAYYRLKLNKVRIVYRKLKSIFANLKRLISLIIRYLIFNIPSKSYKKIIANQVFIQFIFKYKNQLIFILRKLRIIFLADKIENKFNQKKENEYLSLQNNRFLLDHFESNIKENSVLDKGEQ